MSNISRCTVCNAVSSPEIALTSEEYKRQTFRKLPGTEVLCNDCYKEISEVDEDWASEESLEDDEIEYWDE